MSLKVTKTWWINTREKSATRIKCKPYAFKWFRWKLVLKLRKRVNSKMVHHSSLTLTKYPSLESYENNQSKGKFERRVVIATC